MDAGKQMDTTATNVLFAERLERKKCRIILSENAGIGSTYGADSNKITALGMTPCEQLKFKTFQRCVFALKIVLVNM